MNGGQPFSAFFLRNLIPGAFRMYCGLRLKRQSIVKTQKAHILIHLTVTAGNILAGFFIVAGTYHLAYGSPSKKREPRSRGDE